MAEKKKGHVAKKVQEWSRAKYQSSLSEALEAEAAKRGLPPVGHVGIDIPFREYVDCMYPLLNNGNPFVWHRHNEIIAKVLQEVIDGKRRRVMIWLPPRSGKSELVSRMLPAYYISRFPSRWVGLVSYNQDSGESFSKVAKRAYLAAGYDLSADSKAVGYWESGRGGGMWAAGVDSAQLGRGFTLGVIDDPIKNQESADSATAMEKMYRWYDSTFFTRGNLFAGVPDAIVIVQQRWSDYDLCGWLLSRPSPEPWHIVCLEAVKDSDPPEIPEVCTLEPDWRQPGEYLLDSPEFKERVKYQKESAPFVYFAEYQQRPTKGVGERVSKDHFQFLNANSVPSLKFVVRAWDTTVSRTSRDWTVGVKLGIDEQNNMYVLDLVRTKGDATEIYELIVQTALTDGDDVAIAVEEAAISKQTIQELKREQRLGRFEFRPVKVDSTKGNLEKRSAALFSRIRNRQMFLVEASWNPVLVSEFVRFTGSKNDTDDIVSACTVGMSATYGRRGVDIEESRPEYMSPAWWAMRQRERDQYRQRAYWES